MLRIQFVDPLQPTPKWLNLKPRFVQAVESAMAQLGSCAELLSLVEFSNYRNGKRSRSIVVDLQVAYMFDGRMESIVPINGFIITENGDAFWHRVSSGIVGKIALAAHEVAHAHKRTGDSLRDLLASVTCANGAVAEQFHCPKCTRTMHLFGNMLICHQCGGTKPC